MNKKRKKLFPPSASRLPLSSGMTLVEMTVVISIVALVSAVIVFNYSNFKNNVTIRGLSQDIALSVRKAQTYATSVQSIDGSGGSTANIPGFGISFAADLATSPDAATPSKKQFVLFADMDGDEKYDGGTSCGSPGTNDECVESFSIQSADRIIDLCYEDGDPTPTCVTDKEFDIVFKRPAPDAYICVRDAGGCVPPPAYAIVVVQAVSGAHKEIHIWNTGQISVE